MSHAQDHFSKIATQYASGRIGYPEALYDFLVTQCPGRDLAWDCATGSGQAALSLAGSFSQVIATDISEELLKLAPRHPRISYRLAAAEQSGLEANSADLITVAQALHWFDLPRFWPEVDRVLKNDGILAFWGYNWPVAAPAIDRVLEDFKTVISSSWPERSAVLHAGYSSVHPPFSGIPSPALVASAQWELEEYLSHLRSWSATRYYGERTGKDVIQQFRPAFTKVWTGDKLPVRWPLILRVVRKE